MFIRSDAAFSGRHWPIATLLHQLKLLGKDLSKSFNSIFNMIYCHMTAERDCLELYQILS